MSQASFGQRVRRNEDPALLSGSARFIDDLHLPGMLHAAFLRSDFAHAQLRGIDADRARRCEGVVAVITAADMGDLWRPGPLLVPPPPIEGLVFNEATQVPLVRDRIRHAGEPLAVDAMQVAVDPETFEVQVSDYGRVINPLILDGQIHGDVAHGIGNAFFEQLVFDSGVQLQSASFMDYLLPAAQDVPRVRIDHIETPAADTPLGVKGAGEADCIPTGALFAQAVEDALRLPGLEVHEIPIDPHRLFHLVAACGGLPANGSGETR